MFIKRGLFLASILAFGMQVNASAQSTAEVAAASKASLEVGVVSTQPVALTPAAPNATAPVALNVTPPSTQSVETAPVSPQPAATAASVLTAKDFILKQDELAYGVTLISKAAKISIPFESNPCYVDDREQVKAVAGKLFPDVKELADNLNAISINLMSYKKDDKDVDFGFIALELKETSKADSETFKGLIKTSMLSYFKEESFFIADKFPMIVVIAHNLPDGKKDDVKWAFDLAQKKFEK